MPSPTFSVILTSHNRAKTLRRAAMSIVAQTYTNWELIIVDDGSTDLSPAVARDLAATHPRITAICQKNAGVAAARNAGAQAARGEFLAFLDDDDISRPNRLQRQVDTLRAQPNIAACVCNFTPIGQNTPTAPASPPQHMWQGTGHAFRRAAYLATGGYRPWFRLCEDTDFFLLFQEKHDYTFIDEILYEYQVHHPSGGNLTNQPPYDMLRYKIAAHISAHCRRRGQADPIAANPPLDHVLQHANELPANLRAPFLKEMRNAGRRLLASRMATPARMTKLNQHLQQLAADDPHTRRLAKKHRRWLALQSLRHANLPATRLFWR